MLYSTWTAARSFVLVELGSTEKSPARSPTKSYAPIEVIPLNQLVDFAPGTNHGHINVIAIEGSTVEPTGQNMESRVPFEDLFVIQPPTPEILVAPRLSGITSLYLDNSPGADVDGTLDNLVSFSKLQISARFIHYLQPSIPVVESTEAPDLAEHKAPSEVDTDISLHRIQFRINEDSEMV